MDKRPIGILDSGVGGLTVWREIQKLLPGESTIYIGDSKNAPYGDKSAEEIFQLSSQLIRCLLKKNVKLIIIACNVISTTSLERLRNEFKDIPLIGTVPIVKKAARLTKKKKIGVLSTNGTAKSLYQKHLLEQFTAGLTVFNLGNNTLVPLIEKGEIAGQKIEFILQKSLAPFLANKVDVVVLGCTHFPFVKKSIQNILGKGILLLDSGSAIARQVRRILEKNSMKSNTTHATHVFFTTGDTEKTLLVAKQAKFPITSVTKISLRE